MAADSFSDCDACPTMVEIPPGEFLMGADETPAQQPRHKVSIDRAFAVSQREVSVQEFSAFVTATAYNEPGGCWRFNGKTGWDKREDTTWQEPGFEQTADSPVVCISHTTANAYAAWLSEKTGKHYRLLTEAEWEYVARAGSQSTFPWQGDASRSYANFGSEPPCCSGKAEGADTWFYTSPGASFPANEFGLFDLHGNAWEWVQDCWHDSYLGAPADGQAWKEDSCDQAVLRGGSWSGLPSDVTSASRSKAELSDKSDDFGFRVAREVSEELASDKPRSNGNPSWSPAGNRLVFSSNRSGNGDLYLLDLDSTTLTLLIGGDAVEIHSSWSPNGQWVAFDSNRSGNMDLWRADAEGSSITQLTNTPDANELVPSWSPDGSKILFNRVMDDGMDVWLMDSNGGNEQNLTRSPGDDIARGWSPDGRTIAFNSNRDGDHDIYLMNADGTSVRQLTNHPGDERIALWAPDGDHIYFARSHGKADGGRELVRLEVAIGKEQIFFDSPHEDFYPVWSADGHRMAVVVRHADGSDLYELSAEGEIVQRLTR